MCTHLCCCTHQLEWSVFVCCHICLPLSWKLLETKGCVTSVLRTVPGVQEVLNKSSLNVFFYYMQSNLTPFLFTTLNSDIKHVKARYLIKITERAIHQQRAPVFLFLEGVFYAQNVKGKPGVVPTQPPPTSQEAAQLGLGPEPLEKNAGSSHIEQTAQHPNPAGSAHCAPNPHFAPPLLPGPNPRSRKHHICLPCAGGWSEFVCLLVCFSFRKDQFSIL